MRDPLELIDQTQALLEPEGGNFYAHFNDQDGQWTIGLEWGREAPDSDMVGAAAFGTGKIFIEAWDNALNDAGK